MERCAGVLLSLYLYTQQVAIQLIYTQLQLTRESVLYICFTRTDPTVLYNTAEFTDELNITIDSSPKLGYGTVCVNESVNLTCLTDQNVEIITWYWLDQSKEGSHITVQATLSDVVYTCKASDNNGQMGETNITVGANGRCITYS